MVRTSEFEQTLAAPSSTPAPAPPAIPLAALDYAPPPPRGVSRRETVWVVVVSVLLANGVGWTVFGGLMLNGYRDDHAGPVAAGLASLTLGLSLAVLRHFARQAQQQQQHRSR